MLCALNPYRMQADPERRRHPRAPLGTDALVITSSGRHLCTVVDVSAGGISIRCQPQVELDDFVQIDFFLPYFSQWFSAEAVVVNKGKNTWGLQFHAPDSWTISHIQTFVSDRLAPCLT